MAEPTPRQRRMALAKLLERNLPAKPDPKGQTVVPDADLSAAVLALKE
jgi:hypothetical protein